MAHCERCPDVNLPEQRAGEMVFYEMCHDVNPVRSVDELT
jgi:hypothetical protein